MCFIVPSSPTSGHRTLKLVGCRGDVPVPGQGGEAEAVEVKVEQVGEFEGAQDRRDGQIGAAAVGFGGQERVVEGGVVGDQDAVAQQRRQLSAMSAYRGWPASMAGVRPWMSVGPGSTPGSSSLYIEFSIAPPAVTVGGHAQMRASAGSKPDVSTSTTTKSLAVFISSASLPVPTRTRNRLARSSLPSEQQISGNEDGTPDCLWHDIPNWRPIDCYQIVTRELSDFRLPTFVTLACRECWNFGVHTTPEGAVASIIEEDAWG